MNFIVWDKSLSIDVRDIDEQHKRIIDHLNELYTSFKNNPSNTIDLAMVKAFFRYIEHHHVYEQQRFSVINYPEEESHRLAHDFYRGQILLFIELYSQGSPISIEMMLVQLKDWIIEHIVKHDKKMANYLVTYEKEQAQEELA